MSIIYANTDNFNESIESGVTLVDFYADWCGPCQIIAPELDKLNNELTSEQSIVKVNVDNAQEIASQYGVMSIPTIILFKNGKKVDSKVGVQSAEDLKTWINSYN